jgi:hypothetical protein
MWMCFAMEKLVGFWEKLELTIGFGLRLQEIRSPQPEACIASLLKEVFHAVH